MSRGRLKGWAERGEKGGRPKGSFKPDSEKGRKTVYKTFSVSCLPDEYERIKALAIKKGKSISRMVIDSILNTATEESNYGL